MDQYLITEECVTTEDFQFYGHDLARLWTECAKERAYSLWTLPHRADPRYPMLTVYFSNAPWTHQQLMEFEQGNLAGLVQRTTSGEGVIGFQYDIRGLTAIRPLSLRAAQFLPLIGLSPPVENA